MKKNQNKKIEMVQITELGAWSLNCSKDNEQRIRQINLLSVRESRAKNNIAWNEIKTNRERNYTQWIMEKSYCKCAHFGKKDPPVFVSVL